MNEGLTGVERHEGEELMTEISFLGTNTNSQSSLLKAVEFRNVKCIA